MVLFLCACFVFTRTKNIQLRLQSYARFHFRLHRLLLAWAVCFIGAIIAIVVAVIILQPNLGASMEGLMRGHKFEIYCGESSVRFDNALGNTKVLVRALTTSRLT